MLAWQVPPGCPAPLLSIWSGCWSRDPATRLSVSEIIKRLELAIPTDELDTHRTAVQQARSANLNGGVVPAAMARGVSGGSTLLPGSVLATSAIDVTRQQTVTSRVPLLRPDE